MPHVLEQRLAVAGLKHLGQAMKAIEAQVLVDVLGVDDAAVAQSDAALLAKEGHVAIEVEKPVTELLFGHGETLDDFALAAVLLDDLGQVFLRLDAVEHVGRSAEDVADLADLVLAAHAEAVALLDLHAIHVCAGLGQFALEIGHHLAPATVAAALAHAEEEMPFERRIRLGVEHLVEDGLAALHVLGEDVVDQVAVDLLVFDGYGIGDKHADNRLTAAPPRAPGAAQDDIVAPRRLDVATKLVVHIARTGGVLTRRRAHLDAYLFLLATFSEHALGFGHQGVKSLSHSTIHGYPHLPASRYMSHARTLYPTVPRGARLLRRQRNVRTQSGRPAFAWLRRAMHDPD